jgi:hypothetical protein
MSGHAVLIARFLQDLRSGERLLSINTVKRADNGRVANVIVMRDSSQAQALVTNHARCLAFLVRSEARLGTKTHSPLFGSGSAAICARHDARPLILCESREKRDTAYP